MKILLSIPFLLITYISLGQTTTNVDYSVSNPGLCNINNNSQCCNVFNMSGNNPSVGGLPHWPVSGGATYNGTTVNLRTTKNATTDNGTAYGIKYNFRTGYTYKITVDLGYTSNPATTVPRIDFSYRASLPNPGDTDPTVCGPVSGSKYASSIGTVINSVTPSQTGIKNYTVSNGFSVTALQEYLIITAFNGAANGSTVMIQKIVITEQTTALPAVFTLDPTSVSINCGTSVTRTFTVTNVNNSPGTLVHTWNLGSASNGWKDNFGNSVPQIINTGSTPTLTLTSDAAATTVSNVGVTVNLNGTNVANLTSTVNLVTPTTTFNIIGPDMVCRNTTTTYTLQQTPPAGTTVTWSIYPDDGSVTLTPAGNSVTLDASNVTMDRHYNLTVSVVGNCYQGTGFRQFYIPVSGWSGGITGYQGWQNAVYSSPLVEGDNYLYLANGATWFEALLSSSYQVNYAWSNVWWEYVSGDYTPYANAAIYRIGYNLSPYGGTNGYIDSYYNFHYTDNCGTYSIPFHFMHSYSNPPGYRMQQVPKDKYQLSITPNPANVITLLKVQEIEEAKTVSLQQFDYTKPVSIRIYDKLGTVVLQQYTVIPKTGLRVNIAKLKQTDIYNVVVDDGKGLRVSGKLFKH